MGASSDVNGNVIKHNIAKGARPTGSSDSANGFIGLEVRPPRLRLQRICSLSRLCSLYLGR
jgi:hypothetical protein